LRIRLRASAVLLCVAACCGLELGREGHALAAADPAPAADASSPSESTHRARGQEHFTQGEYDAAISEFRKAYELEADPAVLYDIALAYQELGVPERARFFYRRYLSVAPLAPNRREVEERVAALDRVLPALPPAAPPSSTEPSPGPAADVSALAPPPEPPSLFRRWWFWTAVGVAAGATLTVIALRHGHGDDLPASTLGSAKLF
jgi:tetratricopeptide (TPR) repeat protein